MSYADDQPARDKAYAGAYKTWVASLPPDERARLAEQGLLEPDASRRTSTRQNDPLRLELTPSEDSTLSALRAPSCYFVDHSEPSAPSTSDFNFNSAANAAADALAAFCARIRSHPNPLLAFDAACFASGLMDVEGLSQTELARRHGVTRAAFSKLVIQWSETFGLPPSRGMRSKKARRAYRRARLTSLHKTDERRAA